MELLLIRAVDNVVAVLVRAAFGPIQGAEHYQQTTVNSTLIPIRTLASSDR